MFSNRNRAPDSETAGSETSEPAGAEKDPAESRDPESFGPSDFLRMAEKRLNGGRYGGTPAEIRRLSERGRSR